MTFRNYILVCGGTACESSKADDIYQALLSESKKQGVENEVQIVKTGCFGFCEQGPIVKILPEDSFYVQIKPEDAQELIAEHVIKGREVKRLLYNKEGKTKHTKVEDIEFYQKQYRIVLRNCGFIDPENIDEYIAREGYAALEKVLFEMSADDVIIMKDDLTKVASTIKHSRRTMAIIKQNIVLAIGVKVIVMILGIFNIATMWMAIFADTGVALLAVANSLRALRVKK
jgi:(2Fe-2S) ferredoxin